MTVCFLCDYCGKPLKDDEDGIILDGKFFHDECVKGAMQEGIIGESTCLPRSLTP